MAAESEEEKILKEVLRKHESGGSYYSILGLPTDCSSDDVKRAYKKLGFMVHPDKNSSPDATEVFKIVLEAYVSLHKQITEEEKDKKNQKPNNPKPADNKKSKTWSKTEPNHNDPEYRKKDYGGSTDTPKISIPKTAAPPSVPPWIRRISSRRLLNPGRIAPSFPAAGDQGESVEIVVATSLEYMFRDVNYVNWTKT